MTTADYYRRGHCAEHIPRLEFAYTPSLRTPLTGLAKSACSYRLSGQSTRLPLAPRREVGKAGCEGWLTSASSVEPRSRPSAKLLSTCRETRRLTCPSQTAHPIVTRPARCARSANARDIRASQAVRHRDRTQSKSLPPSFEQNKSHPKLEMTQFTFLSPRCLINPNQIRSTLSLALGRRRIWSMTTHPRGASCYP
jgi:hypothetical protein